jgi:hypothetical protein
LYLSYNYNAISSQVVLSFRQTTEKDMKTREHIGEKHMIIKVITRHLDDFIADVSTADDKVYQTAEEG